MIQNFSKKIVAGVLTGVLAISFIACGSTEKTSGEALQTIKFGIAPGTIRTALVLLADHLGYYEEEGVNVELVEVGDATAALTSISTGGSEIDVWGTGIVPDLNFIANGSDIVIFQGTAAEGGAIISTPENVDLYKDLNNYQDITIATKRAESAWVVTRSQLKKIGIDVDNKINIMEVDSEANVATAVAKGEAQLGFLPAEYATKFADIGVETVYEVGELEPLYVCCRQATSSTKLEEKHNEFVKFTIANLRAYEYYNDKKNKEDIVNYLAEYSDQTIEYVEEYLFQNRTVLTLDPNEKGIANYYDALVESGYYQEGIDVASHIDTSNIYRTSSVSFKCASSIFREKNN